MAQMDIYEQPSTQRSIVFRDTIAQTPLYTPDYFSAAAHRAERDSLRKARNTTELSVALQGGLNQYNNAWQETSGGDNSVSLLSTIYFKHKYTKNKFSVETSVSVKYGYYCVSLDQTVDDVTTSESVWYKNQDEFQVSVSPAINISSKWSYGSTLKFRSQFSKGYVSSSSQEDINLKSDFMAPGYLDLSVGFNYQCSKEKLPFKLTLSPLAFNGVFVSNADVRWNAYYQYLAHESANALYVEPYGVNPYESSKIEAGSSIQIDLDRSFGKDGVFRYVTSIFSFYGWISELTYNNLYHDYDEYKVAIDAWNETNDGVKPMLAVRPTLRWENKLEIKATKLLSTTLNFQLYYNRAQNINWQTQTLLSVGFAYTFKNK